MPEARLIQQKNSPAVVQRGKDIQLSAVLLVSGLTVGAVAAAAAFFGAPYGGYDCPYEGGSDNDYKYDIRSIHATPPKEGR